LKPDPSDRQSDNYTIKVAIIEDHQEIRDGLGFLIDSTEGYRLTASFGSVEEALERLGCDLPDVALVDIGLPGMSGIEGAKILKQRWADISIIALTVYDDDERIFDMLCAGASGYLLKKTPPARLIESLKDAVRGGSPMSQDSPSRKSRLQPHPARIPHPETSGGRAYIQDGCGRAGKQRQHRRLPHAEHLSQAASPFQIRSCCQSPARPPGLTISGQWSEVSRRSKVQSQGATLGFQTFDL